MFKAVVRAFDATTGIIDCTIPQLYGKNRTYVAPFLRSPSDIALIRVPAAGSIVNTYFDAEDNGLLWMPSFTKGIEDLLTTHTSQIATNATNIATNTADIASNTSTISSHTSTLNTLTATHGGKWRRVATQSYTSGGIATIQWDTEDADDDNALAPTDDTWTCKTAGVFAWDWFVSLASVPAPTSTQFARVNFTGLNANFTSFTLGWVPNAGATSTIFGGSFVGRFAVNDTVTVSVIHSAGSNKNVTAQQQVFWLRP